MSNSMRKITYYENVLEFKENSKENLNLYEINNWELCRTCLTDTGEDDINLEKTNVIDVTQGNFLSIKEMLLRTTNINFSPIENLPWKVCEECFSKITALYSFSLQVNRAEKVLIGLANKLKDYQDAHKLCETKSYYNEADIEEDNVMYELEEVFDNIQSPENMSYVSNIPIDGNETLSFVLNTPADIKETSECFEDNSKSEAAPVSDEEYNSDLKMELSEEESHMEKDLFEELINSDFDDEETSSEETGAITTNNTNNNINTTEKVKYEVKRLKKFSNEIPSGYRHKQPRVSSPLLTNFTCAICKDPFDRQHDLVHHVRKSHPNSKAYKCRICGNLFSHIQSLSRHMNVHKESVVLNECEFCPKTFVRVDDLKRHLRVHTGERPYVCPFCEKSFQQQFAWKNHQEKHMYMGSKFQLKYDCTQCELSYSSRNSLSAHRRKHHSEDNDGLGLYACSLCEKTFHYQSDRKRHEEKHFLPELIKCTQCDKYFKSKNGMYMHRKNQHKIATKAKKDFEKEIAVEILSNIEGEEEEN